MPKAVQKQKERDGTFHILGVLYLVLIGLPKGTHNVRPLLSFHLYLRISRVYLHLNHEETHSSGNPTPNRVYTLVLQVAG